MCKVGVGGSGGHERGPRGRLVKGENVGGGAAHARLGGTVGVKNFLCMYVCGGGKGKKKYLYTLHTYITLGLTQHMPASET